MKDANAWTVTRSRRLERRRLLRIGTAAVAGASAALLIACGGDDEEGASSSQQAAPTGAAPSAPGQVGGGQWEGVKRGGIYTGTAFGNDPPTLDPFGHLSFLSQYIGAHSYGRLLKFRTGPGVTPLAEIVPDLAEKYEVTDNAQTWILTLRSGIKFQDKAPLNGRDLVMDDVLSSYERFRVKSPNGGSMAVVDRVESPDARTVVFKLKQPFAPFPELLASPNGIWVMSKEANAGTIDPTQVAGVVGTGPWILEQHRPSVELTFKRNANYYERMSAPSGQLELPLLDGLRYLIIPEYAQQLSQFTAGVTTAFTPRNADAASVRDRVSGVQVKAVRPGWLWAGYSFNTASNNGLFKDERVRKAWSMALDRDGLIDAFAELRKMKSQGFDIESGWSTTCIPWGEGGMYWWLDPKGKEFGSAAKWYQLDPAEAKKLLQAAGYSNDPIDMNFVTGTYGTTYDQFTEAQIPMLRQAGFNINPKVWEYRRMIGSEESKTFPGAFYNYQTPFSTADEYVFNAFHPDVGDRGAPLRRINTPEIVDLVDKQRRETDRQARQKQIHEIQRLSSEIMTAAPSVMSRWGTISMVQPYLRNAYDYQTAGYGFAAEEYIYFWFNR
jgi:peptide/nickel transport system substrate-binding protein